MNHWSRLPLLRRIASMMPSFSMSTITEWMVPLWRRGSIPRERTRSEQVIGPLLIRAERTAVRMMEVSIGCGAVVFGIVVDGGGTRQGAPQGSGGDGQDRPFAQEAVEAAPPGDRGSVFVVVLLADGIPFVGGAPIAEGVAVHGVAAVEENQQFGIVVVVGDECPATHGVAAHLVPQVAHLVGGVSGGDGGGHRVRCGCLWYCSRWRGQESTHPQGNHQSRSSIAWRRLARVASSFRIARSSLAVGLPSHSHSSS